MAKTPWTPWHEVVKLREELKTGELPLHLFAADLYEVLMQSGKRPIYEDPEKFFALTFPTFNLRRLVRDVVLRVAGENDKAVRQLELTYGGGKTHTLITLRHLVTEPATLPDLPAVAELKEAVDRPLPKARVACLCFDKLDVEKGMEVVSPAGETRTLKHPWSVLAYQVAGDEGLRLLHTEGLAEERESAPAENLLTELLERPGFRRVPARRASAFTPCPPARGTSRTTGSSTTPSSVRLRRRSRASPLRKRSVFSTRPPGLRSPGSTGTRCCC